MGLVPTDEVGVSNIELHKKRQVNSSRDCWMQENSEILRVTDSNRDRLRERERQ